VDRVPRLGGGSKAQVLVTAAWTLALGFLVVVAAAWNLGRATGNAGLLSLLPQDPAVTYDQAMARLRESKGRALPDILPAVDETVHLNPLNGRALFLHALQEALTAGAKPPIAMLEASRRQSPRQAETRLLLLDAYGRSGRAKDALAEANTLMTLMPDQHPLIVRLIAGLAGRPGGPEALERALPASEVRGAVMVRLAQTNTDSALLERLAAPMRGLARDPSQRDWVGNLVTTVARRPDPAAARSLWATLYAVDPARVGAGVSDPELAHGEGDPPFGWRFHPGRAGISGVRDGGLEVYYYGRSRAAFAYQMLLLAPGDYLLTGKAASADAEAPSGFSWDVACLSDNRLLVSAPLPQFLAAPGGAARFSIPAEGCAVQALQLQASPPDVTRSESARIERVAIGRATP
jgi:hypothetical protein